ncbi:MAG: DUF3830 family protein [Thermoleophilaceae bacterium]
MSRGLLVAVPAYDAAIRVELLWADAPATCAAIWAALPIEKPAFHGRRSGQELFVLADPFEPPGRENARRVVNAGDVVFVHLPPGWTDHHPDFPSAEHGLFDIAFIYGSDACVRGPEGVVDANLFGRVLAEDRAALARVCERVWLEGTAPLRIVGTNGA